MEEQATKFLEGKPITDVELAKLRETLEKGKRLVEVSPGKFKILTRMHG